MANAKYSRHEVMMEEYLNSINSSKTSKVLSEEKYNRIASYLRREDPSTENRKFRWWVTKKGFRIITTTVPEAKDLLVIPKPGKL